MARPSNPMPDFYKYKGAEVSLRLPRYLKARQECYFSRPAREEKLPGVSLVAIEFVDAEGAEIFKDTMRIAVNLVSQPDVESRVLRVGNADYLQDGFDLLASTHVVPTGDDVHQYDVVFPLANRYVYVRFVGTGKIEEFETLCRAIASSIRIHNVDMPSAKQATVKTRGARRKRSGLRGKARARLLKSLESLPENLSYLREPILSIAEQNQDFLGTGGADIDQVATAIEEQAATRSGYSTSADAEQLKQWLDKLPDSNSHWAGPVWFTHVFLIGYDAFQEKKE